jgi:hypothetical protein
MNDEIVLCKDCKHSFRRWQDFFGFYAPLRCRKSYVPDSIEVDLVGGPSPVKAYYKTCSSERMFSSRDEICGKQGKLWEPKDKKNFFVYLKRI